MHHVRFPIAFLIVAAITTVRAEEPSSNDFRRVNDIQYAEVDGHRLLLDLYLPTSAKKPPLIVWVHGGAWRRGSKANMPLTELVKNGFAVASVDYRLSPVARFPAQIHDCKAAIRFLRGSAAKYGINAERIGIAGASAGGHLVALIGVTNNHTVLEGDVGEYDDQSSSVQAIVDYYGPTNFMTILKQSTPHGLSVRVPALKLLLGDEPDNAPDLARLASPVFHVDSSDPPLLLIHGDQDPQVPINQSHELHGEYKEHKRPVHFEVVYGGAHGGDSFFDSRRNRLVRDFFTKHVRRK
jgi:acetyl esterase/lipase